MWSTLAFQAYSYGLHLGNVTKPMLWNNFIILNWFCLTCSTSSHNNTTQMDCITCGLYSKFLGSVTFYGVCIRVCVSVRLSQAITKEDLAFCNQYYVNDGFEVLTVTLTVTPSSSDITRRFGGAYHITNISKLSSCSLLLLLVSFLAYYSTLKMEAMFSSEMWVYVRTT
jgi:hypothetical protein